MRAFFLVGSTAVGKTTVAQYIAERDGSEILSADSMLVYKGMDIGTAKPSLEEQSKVVYHGLDIIDPTELSNAGIYRRYAHGVLGNAGDEKILIVGGTGLYVKALTDGLGDEWTKEPSYAPLAGLRMPNDQLIERIELRVQQMYDQGFEAEVSALLEKYGKLSKTAEKGIGYAEVIDLLNNKCSRDEAIETTVRRTRQFAKRQRTWFRHQAAVKWIDIDSSMQISDISELVIDHWKESGPTEIKEMGGDGDEK